MVVLEKEVILQQFLLQGHSKLKQKQTSLFCMPFSVWYKLLTTELPMFFQLHEPYLQFPVLQLHRASYFSSGTMSYFLVVQTENCVFFSYNHMEVIPPLFLHLFQCQISELIFFLKSSQNMECFHVIYVPLALELT